MKGWVYVISNQAMPNLIKVGHSMKDPEIRADELDHTGSPHPYNVEYEMLIDNPYEIEKRVHKLLLDKREGKEWFRCSSEVAVATIKQVAGDDILLENFKKVQREKAEEIQRQQELEKEKQEIERKQKVLREAREREIRQRIIVEENQIKDRYNRILKYYLDPESFITHLSISVVIVLIILTFWNPHLESGEGILVLFVSTIILALLLKKFWEWRKRKSKKYKELLQQHDIDLENVGFQMMQCPKCQTMVKFSRIEEYASPPGRLWKCPKCDWILTPAKE